ncbi:hypothetical protein ANN_22586 [Periplaneta americana]|uniref:Uncharacterized protein n=1 Tax=Periplaneta americana TaxID=6978 RepID=A0ABQ8S970_PERAM|nr:hypothetical protein ANN_22586 [Periplaneta americana]
MGDITARLEKPTYYGRNDHDFKIKCRKQKTDVETKIEYGIDQWSGKITSYEMQPAIHSKGKDNTEQEFCYDLKQCVPYGIVCAKSENKSLFFVSRSLKIGNAPAECEVRSVVKFLNAQGIAPIEIDRQLYQVYGPNVMRKQMVCCSTRSSVMMVVLPLRFSSCTFWRPAENCLQQQRTICLPTDLAQLTINFNRRYALCIQKLYH